MIRFRYIAVILISLASLLAFSIQTEDTHFNMLIQKAETFVRLLTGEKYKDAVSLFDPTMLKLMPEPVLKSTWEGLLKSIGVLEAQSGTRTEKIGKYNAVYVLCRFTKEKIDIKIVFDEGQKIAGLFFLPSQEYKPPTYADRNSFSETDVTIGEGEWSLPGTLTRPLGKGPFPALVCVHGSGPNDRDESIGPNKPFQDIAWGLATQGIAVLRYDKRTKVYQQKMAAMTTNLTVKEETLDDALDAVEFLRKADGIDVKRIFVLGHSLGGMLMPRLGIMDPDIAGLIVMAGPTRHLEDLFLEQMKFAYWLDGRLSDEERADLGKIEEAVLTIKKLDASQAELTGERILGAKPGYWLDLQGYNPAEAAKELKQPLFIIQGGRDYQVKKKDFEGWKTSLSSRSDVAFKFYPLANHLFIMGRGISTPAEYLNSGNVADEVILDIAGWIKNH
ncbi:MAG: alpha/beta fold hydrolase [Candidatus Aminicenantes bacterium]|nr:alpha/beta fold hydrolase [Candidatus Aminicenantes bacterium]